MSTSALMSIGMRAMSASNAALQTTGHNIANASVEGYSRQEVLLQTSSGQFTGAGFFGKGVNVVNVRRAHDQFLTMQAAAAKSLAAKDQARADQLNQMEEIFPAGTQGLGYAMGDFFAAVADLANSPADESARQVVLARAADVAGRFSSTASRLDILQSGVRSDMETSADTLNGLLSQVATLNQQIAGFKGVSQEPNDLLDQRDQLISQISDIVEVTTVTASDGSVGVFLAGGQRLVLGTEAAQIRVGSADPDGTRAALSLVSYEENLPLDVDQLSGGSLAGLLRFQNEDLVAAQAQVGQMAMAFASKVNEAQSLGLDLGNPPGAGAPMFSLGSPAALPSALNARDGSGQLIAGASLAVTDASLLQASEYELTPGANAGEYTLVRLSDGLSRTVNSGDEVDGFSITVDPDLQPGDKFLLQPVTHVARDMVRALDKPSAIAAASPLSAVTNVANTGSATVASLGVTADADTALTAEISFTSDSGDYSWTLTDSDGNVTGSGNGTWTAGRTIEVNGFELNLNGVPKSGDGITVSPTLYPASSNGNALAMSSLADDPFVGRTLDAYGNIGGGATATDAYAAVMADVGVRTQSANNAANSSTAVLNQVNAQLGDKTGVNLDEEASRLIQYQQAYQAAAKVLQVAQSVFDTMLNIAS